MRSKILQEILDKMEKDSWWVKLKRWFVVEIHVIKCLGIIKYMKHKLIFFLFVTNLSYGQKMTDDIKHIVAGVRITALSSFVIYRITDKPFLSCVGGLGIGTTTGLAKEYIWDKALGQGVFNKEDYKNTFYGSVIGYIGIQCIINIKPRKKKNLEKNKINF